MAQIYFEAVSAVVAANTLLCMENAKFVLTIGNDRSIISRETAESLLEDNMISPWHLAPLTIDNM